MRFHRYPRYEPVTKTDRKIKAFERKQEKERMRYPLFADHIASEQHTVDAEFSRRSSAWDSTEAGMRAHYAMTWRTSRARYFSLPAPLRDQIRIKWNSWVGPRTATYFAMLVDVESGGQAQRLEQHKKERRDVIAGIARSSIVATPSLF